MPAGGVNDCCAGTIAVAVPFGAKTKMGKDKENGDVSDYRKGLANHSTTTR